MQEKIFEVTNVSLLIEKTNPLTLRIDASGAVSTSGWENGQLQPHIYIVPPPDGIYGFDFVANAPTGIASQVISDIESEPFRWQGFPDSLKGVKVHSSTNAIVEMI
jgi:hypothetical protein